jgi:hypothetical protein
MGYWEAEFEDRPCIVCSGVGYTERAVKPIVRTEVIGYE